MQIVFAAAEAAPYAKVGGLADVAGSLPQALAALGHDVTLYLPLHKTIDRAKFQITERAPSRSVPYGKAKVRVSYPSVVRDGVRVVFVRNDKRIGRDRVYGEPDDAKRYAFFCRAVLEDIRESPPDVVHAHDWHAALLVPLVARTRALAATSTVFTIHNLAYQGRTDKSVLALIGLPRARLPIEDPGEANPMARAIVTADIVSTVSERYAKEILTDEFGEGLQGLLRERRRRLVGIVNGIDTIAFDPATDRHVAAHYSADDPSGKAACKAALQKEGALDPDPRAPVFGVVGRLVEQKGVDLLTACGAEASRRRRAAGRPRVGRSRVRGEVEGARVALRGEAVADARVRRGTRPAHLRRLRSLPHAVALRAVWARAAHLVPLRDDPRRARGRRAGGDRARRRS